ncbi:MAG: hypothetical protein JWN70_5036 [Planctomycetaceae bacterium]|nr:hypothetical protein [Planctomycetaceae bacterium]
MNNLADRLERDLAPVVTPVLPTEPSAARNLNLAATRSTSHLVTFAVAALLLAAVPGCGAGKPAWEQVFPATGTLTYNGKPIEGAEVVLLPKDDEVPDRVRPSARTDASGRFELSTYDIADGAPEGDYDVAVTWRPLIKHSEGSSPGPNRLPARYASPTTSKLTVHVNSEDTDLKILALTP